MKPGEALDVALVREVGEEIGVVPTAFRTIGTIADLNASPDDPVIYYLYVVEAWTGGEPVALGDEHAEQRWFEPEAAIKLPDLAPAEYRDAIARAIHRA